MAIRQCKIPQAPHADKAAVEECHCVFMVSVPRHVTTALPEIPPWQGPWSLPDSNTVVSVLPWFLVHTGYSDLKLPDFANKNIGCSA